MSMPKEIYDLKEKINDTMESVRAVKGETFAEILEFLNYGVQMTKLVAMASKDADSVLLEAMSRQLATTMTMATDLLFKAHNFKQEDEDEIFKFVHQMSEHVDAVMFRNIGGKS